MIPQEMARKLLGGAATAAGLAADVARHVVWYVRHQVSGEAREPQARED
jgi:hypothetical protein